MEVKQIKNLYKSLQRDDESVFYASEKVTNGLTKKAKKSNYPKDKVFLKLFRQLEAVNVNIEPEDPIIPTYTPFVEQKKDIDRSTLYSIDSPFDLLHADIADIRFLAKSAVDPHYCLVIVDLFTQKLYTHPMKKLHLLRKKMELFYNDIASKREHDKTMRLQTDLEFQQTDIKKLNKKFNVSMFSTKVRGGKSFAAEQKIRKLKKLLLRGKNNGRRNKIKINPNKLIQRANNLNKTKSEKYGIEPETVEEESLKNNNFKEMYDFHRLERIKQDFAKRDRYNTKVDQRKTVRLRDPLEIGEKVLVLSERLKKKDAPGFLYKSTTENRSFFNKDKIFIIRKRVPQTPGGTFYYWLSSDNSDRVDTKRYLRQELFALNRQCFILASYILTMSKYLRYRLKTRKK